MERLTKSGNYEIITNAAKSEDEGKRVLNICMDFWIFIVHRHFGATTKCTWNIFTFLDLQWEKRYGQHLFNKYKGI